jgi:hypothetical protein
MTDQKEKPSRIPEFANREEMAEWFDAHDVADYLDEFEIVDRDQVQVSDNLSENLTVRLSPELLHRLRGKAKRMGVGPSTLARMWIVEHLQDANHQRVSGE